MGILNQIITSGNMPTLEQMRASRTRDEANWIHCVDGFKVSVIAGPGTYCSPRPAMYNDLPLTPGFEDAPSTYPGPYTAVEVGFPSQRPEPWSDWHEYREDDDKSPTETVYGYVPVDLVRTLIESHGGEK